jgi:hypothetical protein
MAARRRQQQRRQSRQRRHLSDGDGELPGPLAAVEAPGAGVLLGLRAPVLRDLALLVALRLLQVVALALALRPASGEGSAFVSGHAQPAQSSAPWCRPW